VEASALQAPAGLGRFSVSTPLLRLRSDDQLVALFRAGNEAAFGVIHDRYRQRLFAYTRQMLSGSRQDAEDALQDVFLRAYGALRADDRPVTLRAWLYRVAHNRCIDQLRRVAPAPADVLDVSRTPLHDPLAEAERREDLRRLVDDVRRLPEQQRSALLMRELEGLSYQELAGALGVTVPAVKSLLVRARIGLAEAVEARDAACGEVRAALASAHGRGVRSSGLARRHMRDCPGCREYRHQLKLARRSFAALSPAAPGPISALLQFIGVGGGGSGAAAAGTGAVGAAGTAGAVITSAGTATKVAAIVCGAAITAGGAVEVHHRVVDPPSHPAPTAKVQKATPPAPAPKLRAAAAAVAPVAATTAPSHAKAKSAAPEHKAKAKKRDAEPMSPHSEAATETTTPGLPFVTTPSGADGGVAAPNETDPVVVGQQQQPQEPPAPATTGGSPTTDPAGSQSAAQTPAASGGTTPPAQPAPPAATRATTPSDSSGGLPALSAP
jgi:RNA polymerase sigma factor (sigma-70 family)